MADDQGVGLEGAKLGIDALLELRGANRAARAYAFLYASFKKTEISSAPVRDALDCLIPFITPYLNQIAGKQVDIPGMQSFLMANFEFDIPLYALEQLLPVLQAGQYVEYHKGLKRFVAKTHENRFSAAKEEIATEFDEVVSELTKYASNLGYPGGPPSGTWGGALITFLKTRSDDAAPAIAKIKGVLMDPRRAESSVVGSFLRVLHSRQPVLFEKVVHVFQGVLIEEFISSVSEIGPLDAKRPVKIFYDTALLMRLMGCSGQILRTATEELTRYLQDLGFNIYYFSGNEAEVAGILNALIYVKDSGRELEGETAEAISNGEISITTLRMLQNTFTERLAGSSVFPAEDLEADALKNAQYQIDEKGFGEILLRQSLASGRAYGQQNRLNDASYVGNVMRLRRNIRTRDLANAGYIFVTSNKFLASASRRYLIEQRMLQPQHCPPVLSAGQMATIAWLLRDKALAPEKASRELLANCYAAVRPDAEWFKHFREGIESIVGSLQDFSRDQQGSLALQAARRISQDESFGNAALVRELNMSEILSRAKEETDQRLKEQEESARVAAEATTAERKRLEETAAEQIASLRRKAVEDQAAAVRTAEEETRRTLAAEIGEANRRRARSWARSGMVILKTLCIAVFFVFTGVVWWKQGVEHIPAYLWCFSAVLAGVSLFAFADLLGLHWISNWSDRAEDRFASSMESFLSHK